MTPHPVQKLACDAMLGGAARWLRAYGYETFWTYHIDDGDLVALALKHDMTLITADRQLMQRRLIVRGELPALYIPYGLSRQEQLQHIITHLQLPRLAPRCMACGGGLEPVDKASVWDRLPTKTRLWLDHFWICLSCDRLFWKGTHWGKIERQLQQLER